MSRRGAVVALLLGVAWWNAGAPMAAAAPEEWTRTDLVSFGQRDPQGGRSPDDAPVVGSDGLLYGTARSGGAFGRGVVYRFNPADQSYLVLRHFIGDATGGLPFTSAFLQASDGRLYGLALN